MVGNMISCDEEASHCATDLLSASLPAIKLEEQPAKDANLFQPSGCVASCQDASTRLFSLLFCLNVAFATLSHLWLQKSHISASACTEGQAITLKWVMHHDTSLRFRASTVMPSCCLRTASSCHSVFANSQLQIRSAKTGASFKTPESRVLTKATHL